MQLYLPIADLAINIFILLAMGLAVGFVSGMFGVGGGFLMTPFLIFLESHRVSRLPALQAILRRHRSLAR